MKTVFALLCILLFLPGCTRRQQQHQSTPLLEHTLVFVDSIGVELGDSAFLFGTIADAEFLQDGTIAVLDKTLCTIKLFSPEGEHIRTIGGRGEGPGELLNPFSLYVWLDGTIGVIDPFRGGIHRFSPEGEWLGEDLAESSNSFIDPVVTGDNLFTAFKSRFSQDESAMHITAFIGLFPITAEPSVIYWEKTFQWDPADMGNIVLNLYFNTCFATNPESGKVFVCPFSEDNYRIYSFNPDGTPAGTIEAEYIPVPKTPSEISEEIDFIEYFLRTAEGNKPEFNYICDPWPNHLPVTGLFIGPHGNLWARRGGMNTTTFDIWNDNLERAGVATVPEITGNGSNWKFVFGDELVLAWNENPDSFQKIYLLAIQ